MAQKSIKKNILLNTSYQILNVVLPFITAPYISRVIGSEGIGVYSFTAANQMYFSLFAALGTATYGMREISRARNDEKERSRLFWEIEFLSVLTSLGMLFLWGIFILLQKRYKIIYCILALNIVTTMLDISWFYNGLEEFKVTVYRNMLVKIVGLILIFILVKRPDQLIMYIGIMSITSLAGNLSMWVALPKFITKVSISKKNICVHFKETIIYFIPTIATSVYTILDKSLIGIITNNAYENGYYEQATKIINMIKALTFTSLNSVLGSRISYLYAEKKFEEIKKRARLSIEYILMIGFACEFGLIGIAERFVPCFFGKGYEPVKGLLIQMSPLIVIIGISNCLGSHYYTPYGLRKKSANYIVAGAVVNLGLNILLIPQMGASGAVMASIVAEVLITSLYIYNCDNFLNIKYLISMGWKKLLSGIFMAVLIHYIDTMIVNDYICLLIQILLGTCSYVIICYLLKDNLTQMLIKGLFNRIGRYDG